THDLIVDVNRIEIQGAADIPERLDDHSQGEGLRGLALEGGVRRLQTRNGNHTLVDEIAGCVDLRRIRTKNRIVGGAREEGLARLPVFSRSWSAESLGRRAAQRELGNRCPLEACLGARLTAGKIVVVVADGGLQLELLHDGSDQLCVGGRYILGTHRKVVTEVRQQTVGDIGRRDAVLPAVVVIDADGDTQRSYW